MLCQQCHEREATLHFTKIVNGKVNETHLCEQCAREKGKYIPGSNGFSIHHLLSGLLNFDQPFSQPDQSKSQMTMEELKCPRCHMTYEQFVKTGRFGCSDCYNTFNQHLDPILKRVHGGNTVHRGKIPKRTGNNLTLKRQLEELRKELQEYVHREEFEKAAVVRDKIRSLEQQVQEDRGE